MTTDKQQEEIFIKIHRIATVENINFASIQWKLFDEAWQAAQAAMQPEKERYRKENDILRGLIAVSDVACIHCGLKDISQCRSGFPGCSRADDIIAAEDAVYTSTRQQLSAANQRITELLDLVEVVERRNKQLEANLNQVRSTYNQIIAEDTATRNEYLDEIAKLEERIEELEARIEELEARIRVADAEEPVGYTFVVWDGRVRREHLAIDYMVQYDKVYGWEEIRGKTPLYAKPVIIKEQP